MPGGEKKKCQGVEKKLPGADLLGRLLRGIAGRRPQFVMAQKEEAREFCADRGWEFKVINEDQLGVK